MVFIAVPFFVIAMWREVSTVRSRTAPREVLYSTFVSLLDSGRVRAARLETGTGRVYFDLRSAEAEVAAASTASAAPAAAAAAPDAAATGKGAKGKAAAAASAVSAAQPKAAPEAAKAPQPQQQQQAAAAAPRMQKQFFVKMADKSDTLLLSRILASGVEFGVVKASFTAALANVFLTALALWLPLTPLIFILKHMVDERNSASRKKRSNTSAENSTVTFADVAGVDSAKQELVEVVAVLKQQKAAYSRLRVKLPSGVLLCGPPGTGKTLLARAVAGEAGIPFLSVSASEFVELFVGRGAARIRELFAEARKVAPCVVFIDEVDAVGAKRGMGFNDERDQTLNQLLTELDGFDQRPGVLFLAATNRMDVLDPALLRPGRISRKVVVPLPDEPGRRAILDVHLRGVPFASMADLQDAATRIARVTAGFSGAELQNVVNEASLLASRKEQDYVTQRELLEGVQRTKFGVNGRTRGVGSSLRESFDEWLINLATASPAAPPAAQQPPADPRVKTATS